VRPPVAVKIARVYDPPAPGDGTRVLVDRLWPRGIRKDDPRVDLWVKELAPSTQLRQWYAHQPSRFEEFGARYRSELDAPTGIQAIAGFRATSMREPIVLTTATRDLSLSHLSVLAAVVSSR
jgi:uncharacterized protein YeaO (DUF488 family)